MKIQKSKFLKLLTKIHCNGLIHEGIINFEPKQISCLVKETSNIGMASVKAPTSLATEYEAFGEIAVSNFGDLIKLVSRFNEAIEITKHENLLVLKDAKKELELVLPDPEYLRSEITMDRVSTIPFPVDIDVESSVFKDSVVNAEILKCGTMFININNNVLAVTTGDDNKFTEKLSVVAPNQKSKYGDLLKHIVVGCPERIHIKFGQDLPIMVSYVDEEVSALYVVAPLAITEE